MKLVPVLPPVGSVMSFMGNIANMHKPETQPIEAWGWMVCDGRALPKAQYPELYFMLGDIYGTDGDNFNIPNLGGYFLRGIGTDAASTENRQNAPNGPTNGVGSTQDFALQTHIHTYDKPNTPAPPAGDKGGPVVSSVTPNTATSSPGETGTSVPGNVKVSELETRPTNIFVYYIIKYTSYLPSFQPVNINL